MISEAEAREFAESKFPNAPEELASRMDVDIRHSPLDGCDGWVLATAGKAIIRINTLLSPVRRRFTLAHELGHLILGVPSVVGETYEEILRSDSQEEKRVDDLASALLIPARIAKDSLRELPVVASALKQLAKKANVSDLAAAVRVCNLAQEIGLVNASVVMFDADGIRWMWSKTIQMPDAAAAALLVEARKAAPRAFRRVQKDGTVIVASTIENPYFGTATLFVQVLPQEDGVRTSTHERRAELEAELFREDASLRCQVNGCMSSCKTRFQANSKSDAVEAFWSRYGEKFQGTRLASAEGREYVQLRLGEWF